MHKDFHPCFYLQQPDSDYAEMIRGLRTTILRRLYPDKKSLMITSAWENEGKSSVCINLAAAFIDMGLKTLLIDGDLRQRNLTRFLLEQAPQQIKPQNTPWIPGLQILGALPQTIAQISTSLADGSYQKEISQYFAAANIVIIDSPPMSVCQDALLLSSCVDGALMVLSQKKFRGAAEGHFSEDLRDRGIDLWGSVITHSTV